MKNVHCVVKPRWGDPKKPCKVGDRYDDSVYLPGWFFIGIIAKSEIINIPRRFNIQTIIEDTVERNTCYNCGDTKSPFDTFCIHPGEKCDNCGKYIDIYKSIKTTWRIE